MKKIKKVLKILLIILSIVTAFIVVFSIVGRTNADAGYHSSYSSGGSSSSSSHSSSSSSHSSSSSRSSSSSGSYSGSSSGDLSITEMIIIIIIIIIFIAFRLGKGGIGRVIEQNIVSNGRYENTKLTNNINAINEIKKYLPGFDEKVFLQEAYNIFIKIEEAWMNLNMESARDCITDEMFNMYESQLVSMEMKGEQNIMSGFNLASSAISGMNKQNNILEIKTKFKVEFYDYIIDKNTKKVLRGDSNRKIKMIYEFTFIKDIENEKITKCPNCGAPIEMNSSKVCEFCNSKLVDDSKNWVMSKKISLLQE